MGDSKVARPNIYRKRHLKHKPNGLHEQKSLLQREKVPRNEADEVSRGKVTLIA